MSLLEVESLAIHCGPKSGGTSVSFSLQEGEVVWIRGRSGSGKTTLLRQLARLAHPEAGRIRLQGKPWQAISPVEWRNRIAYLHQKAVLFPGTVRENLTKPFSLRSRSKHGLDLKWAEETLSRLFLREDILERDAATVSVGEAARVALVRALMGEPQILLPDEVSAALDTETRNAVLRVMKEWVDNGNRGIVGVIHDDAVMELLPGKVVQL